MGYTSTWLDLRSCVLMQEETSFIAFNDGLSFQHLATVLIYVFTLCYGPGILFRGPPFTITLLQCYNYCIKCYSWLTGMSIKLSGSDVFWANIPTFTCRNLEKLWNLLLRNSGACAQYWNRDFTNTNHFWALKWNVRFNASTRCPLLNILHISVQKHFSWSIFIIWDVPYKKQPLYQTCKYWNKYTGWFRKNRQYFL